MALNRKIKQESLHNTLSKLKKIRCNFPTGLEIISHRQHHTPTSLPLDPVIWVRTPTSLTLSFLLPLPSLLKRFRGSHFWEGPLRLVCPGPDCTGL